MSSAIRGAPVSHLLDVMVDAEDLLADLGVHLETCTNEAAAAAMLGASAWLASESSNPFSTICTKCLAGLSRTPVRAIAAE